MKHAVLIVLFLLICRIGDAQNVNLKGSTQCSLKKMSKEQVPLLNDSPNTPAHSFDVLNYRLSLDIRSCFLSPYSRAYTAVNEMTFRIDTALSSITLNAVNTSMTIDSVRLAGMSFTHASNILTINLNRTYVAGETAMVRIYFRHSNVTDYAFYASNGMVFTDCEPEGARKWFPCWDKPSDKATLDLTAKTPASVKLGSNGRLADSTTVGDTTWFHWVSRDPISTYLIVMTGKVNYNLDIVYWHPPSHPADSVPVRFYWNTGESVTHSKQTIIPMMTYYSQLFGEHPFEKNGFATIASGAGFQWGGMENQTLTSFCPNCWSDNLMSHEFAHQWFGDMITCGTWADVWQNEGFATYCEALWYEYTGGYSNYKNDIVSDANYYLSANPGWPIYNPSWAVITPDVNTLFNTAITYDKGACVLHMLRYTLGDSLFFAVLKSYATDDANFKYGNVVTADFVSKVSQAVGQDLSWFFTWVYQPNHPVYANTYNITSLGGGQWLVGFKAQQTQTNAAFFPMPLTLQISFTAGLDTTFRVMNSANGQVFAFRFGRQPTAVTFDPNNDIVIKQGGASVGPTLVAPSLVAADTVGHPWSPTLVWDQVISAATYRLQVAADIGFSSPAFDDSTLVDTVRQVGPLLPSTQYFWRVRAKNSGGSSPFSVIWTFTTAPMVPAAPTLVSPSADTVNQPLVLTFRWNRVFSAADYRVQVAVDTAFSSMVFSDSTVADTLREVGPLQPSTQYFWRVSAKNTSGSGPFSVVRGFRTTAVQTITYAYSDAWNIVSVPLLVSDSRTTTLFPTAVSSTFAYDSTVGYVVKDTLRLGQGYWLRFNGPQNVPITGLSCGLDTIGLFRGWNLIGAISNPVVAGTVEQIPPGILATPFYAYGGVYAQADTLMPGKGYWIKALAPGYIVLRSGASKLFKPALHMNKK